MAHSSSSHSNGSETDVTPAATPDELAARFLKTREEREVDKLFRACCKLEGSDLHLKVGRPPMVRVRNELKPLNRGPIEIEEMVRLLFPMMSDRNRQIFDKEGGADFAYSVEVDGVNWRFRVNMLQQMGIEADQFGASTGTIAELGISV